jgi:hypothetical protein
MSTGYSAKFASGASLQNTLKCSSDIIKYQINHGIELIFFSPVSKVLCAKNSANKVRPFPALRVNLTKI